MCRCWGRVVDPGVVESLLRLTIVCWWLWRFVGRGCRVVARLVGNVSYVGVVFVVLGGYCCGVE